VLVGGAFTSYNGTMRNGIARLNADGSLDNNFAPTATNSGFTGNVFSLALQPDGKVLVGGAFTSYNGTMRNGIARLNADGSLDNNFAPTATNSGFTGTIYTLILQPDGKVLIGGGFVSYNNTPRSYIARLAAADGSLDSSFVPPTMSTNYSNQISALLLQPDGKVLVGGEFTRSNTTIRSCITRLNTDGTSDSNFTNFVATSSAPNQSGSVRALALQADGKMIMAGVFNSYNGISRGNIARLNIDGTLDTTFPVAAAITSFNGPVYSLALQPDNRILTGGEFTNYNTISRSRIARLNNDGSLNDTDTPATGATYAWTPGGATTASLTVTPTTTTIYTATAMLAGTTANASVVVTVTQPPVITASGPASVCSGQPITLTATQGTGYLYSWSDGLGFSSTGTTPTITTSVINTTAFPLNRLYRLTVTTSGGCQISGRTVLVTINSVPVIGNITPLSGPVNTPVRIYGTGLQGATAVTFNGVASPNPLVFNGSYLLATVPAGATTGPVSVMTPCGITFTSGTFGIVRDLVVDMPTAPTIQPGNYNTITIENKGPGTTGIGILSGNVFVTTSVIVRNGGVLQLGQYHLDGNGFFQLDAGGTLSLGDSAGLAPGRTGAITMTGSRSYSPDASYVYTGTARQATGTTNQVTGTDLPSRVRNLTDSTRMGATLTLSAPTSVAQVLTMASATDFSLNGQPLKLLSSASGTALVVNGPAGGKVVGTATMERYIDPAYNPGAGYRYYSPPVAGATVASLATAGFTPIVNPTYNTSATPLATTPFPTVFRYDQTQLGTLRPGLPAFDNGLVSPTALTEPLTGGTGYAVSILATEKVNFTGTLTTGNQVLTNLTRSAGPLTSNAGWNLVGNPYPAPLNWDLVAAADRANLDAALYTYESTGPNAGIYFSYVNGVGGSPVVAAGKAFFVRVNQGQAAGSLTLRNSHRLTSYATQAGFARPTLASNMIEMELDYDGGKKGGRPPTILYADINASLFRATTSVFNPNLDAYRIPATTGLNLSIDVSAPTQADELAIKAVLEFTAGQLIPLTVRVPQAGSFELHATTVQAPSNLAVFLDDLQLGISTNLRTQPSYVFTSAQPNATFAGRFRLRFDSVLPTRVWSATGDVLLYPNPAHDQATVLVPGLPGARTVEATLLNGLGQVVRQQRAALPATGARLLLPLTGLAAGVYILQLKANDALAVRRLVVE
jgi:uncharacterized delta-60 repeat protein